MRLIKGSEVVTIFRKTLGPVDDFGNPTETIQSIVIEGCLVELGGTQITQTLFRDEAIIDIVVYFPSGTDVIKNDSFSYRGVKYRQSAAPLEWPGMIGSMIEPDVIVGLERYDG